MSRSTDLTPDVAHARSPGRLVTPDDPQRVTRWRRRPRYVSLEIGSGVARRVLSTIADWRADPDRPIRLVVMAIEAEAPSRIEVARRLADEGIDAEHDPAAAALIAAWPPATRDLHRLAFEDGQIELLLAFGGVSAWLPELIAEVDDFALDLRAVPDASFVRDARACKGLARLAAPGAVLTAVGASDAIAGHLRRVGFEPRAAASGDDGPSVLRADWAPRFEPERPPGRRSASVPRRSSAPSSADVLIIGAGLAGCAASRALAEQGWSSVLIDEAPRLASGASGNPAGLFHGVVHAGDGPHARFNRHAAMHAAAAVRSAVADGVPGAVDGLLRLESTHSLAAMQAMLDRLGCPPDVVRAVGTDEASVLAGVPLRDPCWFHVEGGWVDPGALSTWFVERAGGRVTQRLGVPIDRLERTPTGWRVLDWAGRPVAEAPVVVLANAAGSARWLTRLDAGSAGSSGAAWLAGSSRGQLTSADAVSLPRLRRPVAGEGYVMPPVAGRIHFGATSRPDDDDPSLRPADQAYNLERLERLLGRPTGLRGDELGGRVAWRHAAADRLPLVGAVPVSDREPAAERPSSPAPDQPRFVARQQGLYVLAGLGSRGITWAPLAARVLAAWITGAPMPIGASLVDAIDPARFVCRRTRAATRPDRTDGAERSITRS